MPEPVPYTEFPYSNTSLPTAPGPWTIFTSPGDYVYCQPETQERCRDRAYCLACYVSPPDPTDTSYNVVFMTNISVDLTQYGGTNSLAYSWEYWAWWESLSPTGDRIEMTMSSSIGDDVYTDNPSFTYVMTGGGPSMTGDKFYRYSGLAEGLITNQERTIGYIPISINHTFPHKAGEYMGYSVRAVYLGLDSPTTINTDPAIGPFTPSTTSSTSSATSSSPALSNDNKVSISVIIGASIASAALIALLFTAFLLYQHRKRKNRESALVSPTPRGRENGTNGDLDQSTLDRPYVITTPGMVDNSQNPVHNTANSAYASSNDRPPEYTSVVNQQQR
ncbi:hypothetical protein FRC18_000595 [Serendipita sp. 400]|nr:hypothetical protein FRC18_000595 [Serendipita sp. 400]